MVHDLYQEIILDHSKRPRNCHPMDDANRKAEGYNPLCGDKLKLYLKMENDVVKDVSFVGSGCSCFRWVRELAEEGRGPAPFLAELTDVLPARPR